MAADRIYMDTCCFIEVVKNKLGEMTESKRVNDIWYIQACLTAAEKGDLEVITSMFTVVECQRSDAGPTDEVKRLFNSILLSGKVVKLADVTLAIAEKARDLYWIHGIKLKVPDSIHVGTALSLGCKEFLTFDEIKSSSPIKQKDKLDKLGLKAILPSDTLCLPAQYKQQDIDYPK